MAKRLTQEEFIMKAKYIHGDRYDYSKSEYINSIDKVTITCLSHGDFKQAPNKHLQGRGCRSCAYEIVSECSSIPFSQFEMAAREKYGDRFQYDESSYSDMGSKTLIMCPAHGWINVTAYAHLTSKMGCRKCGQMLTGSKNSYGTDEFIKRANEKHGNRYNYDKVVYVDSKTKIVITCREHGDFIQIPGNHIHGSGCPSCAKTGFSPDHRSFLYLLKSECGSMMKIGITKNLGQRISQLKRSTPFDFNIEASNESDGALAMQMEKYYHEKSMSCEFKGFQGASEWFRYDAEIVEEIKKGA